MKIFKNHLKSVRFAYENFTGENRDKIVNKLFNQSIVKCKFNPDSKTDIILIVDKYNILKD